MLSVGLSVRRLLRATAGLSPRTVLTAVLKPGARDNAGSEQSDRRAVPAAPVGADRGAPVWNLWRSERKRHDSFPHGQPRSAGVQGPGEPSSPFPGFRRRFVHLLPVGVALGLVASLTLAGAFSAPAEAQTSVTLVSNNAQTFTGGQSGAFTHDRATSFTTGASRDGYTLTGLTLYMRKSLGVVNASYRVTVNANDSGRPGTILGTLSTTQGIPVSTTTYGALRFSGIVNLAASSTYWVVLDANSFSGNGNVRYSGTASDDEDSGAFLGWSIGDAHLRRPSTSTTIESWGSEHTDALRMNLVGYGRGPGHRGRSPEAALYRDHHRKLGV